MSPFRETPWALALIGPSTCAPRLAALSSGRQAKRFAIAPTCDLFFVLRHSNTRIDDTGIATCRFHNRRGAGKWMDFCEVMREPFPGLYLATLRRRVSKDRAQLDCREVALGHYLQDGEAKTAPTSRIVEKTKCHERARLSACVTIISVIIIFLVHDVI